MDLTLNDLMALKGMGGEGTLTPYEQHSSANHSRQVTRISSQPATRWH